MIFNDLRKHAKLANKRHPMYDKNRFAKVFMYIGAIFWAGYLIMIGSTLPLIFNGAGANREPYHWMNGFVLIFILALDFLLRFPLQKTPTQEVKPYLLLPVSRKKLIDFLLIRSGLSGFNFIWFFLFLPFAVLSVFKLFGIWGVLCYCIGIYLLMIINNYWFLLCKTLIDEHIAFVLLPILFYGGVAALLFIPDDSFLFYWFMDLGDAYIEGHILAFILTMAVILLLLFINRVLISKVIYAELSREEDTEVANASEYAFLNRYGDVGEYMRLELKMLLRNKACKISLRSIFIVIIIFSGLLSFTEVYDSAFMNSFILFYSFLTFGLIMLGQIMSFEGNYIDGLMVRKGSILNLLKAKFYIYSLANFIPVVILIPAMVMGKLSFFTVISSMIFVVGAVHCMLFQLTVYNTKTIPLNSKMSSRQVGTGIQMMVNLLALAVPLGLDTFLNSIWGLTVRNTTLLILGLLFIVTYKYWLLNIYKRFMKRRYKNLEGLRASRT